MDHNEGIQPESMKQPRPGELNGPPSEALRPGAPPAVEVSPVADDAPEQPPLFFNSFNIGVMGVGVCLLLFILYKFTFLEIWAICKAVLGLSFVIFIHELGHFLAAKWCGVNVTTFSIGFGPPIPGCWFTYGETTYKLAILPLGGYVQMVGQVDGDEAADDADDPRSYRKKSVGQRMLIISAGVIMNAILAVFCFIACYQGPGKQHPAAVIDLVDSSAPAFKHGLKSGGDIVKIDTQEKPTFSDFTQVVINSLASDRIQMTYVTHDKKGAATSHTTDIEPRLDKSDTKPIIGVAPPSRLQFISGRGLEEGPYFAGTPAHKARFHYGDVIVAMTDPDDPSRITDLPEDPRNPGQGQRDYFEFLRRMDLLADQHVTVRVKRKVEKDTTDVELTLEPMYRLDLGIRMQMGQVLAIRDQSAADGKVFAPRTAGDKKLDGDVIESVAVKQPDGTWKTLPLDPERLPFELRKWSDQKFKSDNDRIVKLHLARHSDRGGEEKIAGGVDVELKWDHSWRFDRAAPLSAGAPMPIPELGLAYQIQTRVVEAKPGSPLRKGDVIKNIRYDVEGLEQSLPEAREGLYRAAPFLRPEPNTDIKIGFMKKDLEEGQWARVSNRIFGESYKFKTLVFKVERNKQIEEIEMPIEIDKTWPLSDRGWILDRDTRRVRADSPLGAVWLGLVDTKNRMTEIFRNLRGMIVGRISVDNLGGPLTIARATYIFAFMDFADFAFFIGLISINLAVVNFLPIPVLDGGHMVFLLYEKIRGQPASENVRIAATYAGLAVILCLMIFVLYLDVSRLFF